MREIRLFLPELNPGENPLPDEEAHHALHVLRLNPGDPVLVFDGQGRSAHATISSIRRGNTTVDIPAVDTAPFDMPARITVAVGLTKAARQSMLVEKCTELGAAQLMPILADRSTGKTATGLVERWRRRTIEAAKQSGRLWLPRIVPPASLAQALTDHAQGVTLYLADTRPGCPMLLDALRAHSPGAEIIVLIGPEGGWSPEETEAGQGAGALPVSLGPHTLRTETAAIAACAIIAAHMAGQ